MWWSWWAYELRVCNCAHCDKLVTLITALQCLLSSFAMGLLILLQCSLYTFAMFLAGLPSFFAMVFAWLMQWLSQANAMVIAILVQWYSHNGDSPQYAMVKSVDPKQFSWIWSISDATDSVQCHLIYFRCYWFSSDSSDPYQMNQQRIISKDQQQLMFSSIIQTESEMDSAAIQQHIR